MKRGISDEGMSRIAQAVGPDTSGYSDEAMSAYAEDPQVELDQAIVDGAVSAEILTPLDDTVNAYLANAGVPQGSEQQYKVAIYLALITHLQSWYSA